MLLEIRELGRPRPAQFPHRTGKTPKGTPSLLDQGDTADSQAFGRDIREGADHKRDKPQSKLLDFWRGREYFLPGDYIAHSSPRQRLLVC